MHRKRLGGWLGAVVSVLSVASCTVVFGDFQLAKATGTGGAGPMCPAGVATCEAPKDCPAPGGDCVVSACDQGCCTTANAAVNAPCASGLCDGNGACMAVKCVTLGDCPTINSCVTPTCDATTGVCQFTPLADGTPTPGVTPLQGNCHAHQCLSGVDTDVVSTTNLPPAMGDCSDPTCDASGTPSYTPHDADAPCSTYMGTQPGRCDGSGHCVGCVNDDDCAGQTDDCQHPSCSNGGCTTVFTAAGTATIGNPAQIPGDCHKLVCDGAGNHNNVIDDTDAPSSGTVCLTDGCNAGMVVQTANPGLTCGTSMGMPELCNASGQCGCQSNADCTLPNTCFPDKVCSCTPTTCAAVGKTCGSASDGCFGVLACNDGMKDGSETDVDCGGATAKCVTRCGQGQKCGVGSDCQSGFCADGVCCNTACAGNICQACSAAAKGQGADGVCGAVKLGGDPHNDCASQLVSTCGDTGACNGSGACSTWPAGSVCGGTVSCMGNTLVPASTCSGGTCVAGTPAPCPGHYFCSGAACATACGTDDATGDAHCVPPFWCDGVNGGSCDTPQGSGGVCDRDSQCTNGCHLGSGMCN